MHTECVDFYEEITIKAVADTVVKLLKYPFGFHGDTGIRDYLYARLHVHGGARLDIDDSRPGYSTLLLQAEHYTAAKYKNKGKLGQGARFDLALAWPPKSDDELEDMYAENLSACFAFELGKNKSLDKVIDPDMLVHTIDATPGTSDISKLYLELIHHELRQGWAIEFYDRRVMHGANIISKTLNICEQLELRDGKKLVVIFVGFSTDGNHHVSSNDSAIQETLIEMLDVIGIQAEFEVALCASNPEASFPMREGTSAEHISVTVEDVFGDRAAFVNRIIKIGDLEESGRASQYINLSSSGKRNIAQIHPQENGIALVLRSLNHDRPKTSFKQIPVDSLAGYKRSNAAWLDGTGSNFEIKGPAIAFLVPDDVAALDDGSNVWQEIVKLLDHAKTLV